ncbi:HD domain-containing phosphohydrolase [Deinococcus sp. QL22]|uniref:HD domain-containing phosphohydrolase n=1 Tax=Deinococcus sp. QL22 TaxID=2939437 RepID=UPI00273A6456|nr:HD domain-containing phosphohydrolase [Deinococcus sp. QL22]
MLLRRSALSPSVLVLLLIFGGYLVWLLPGAGSPAWRAGLGNLWPLLISVLALVLIVRRIQHRPVEERPGWWAVAGSVLAYICGTVIWTGLELFTDTPPFPSLADISYLLVAPLFTLAVWGFPRSPLNRLVGWRLTLDLLVFLVAAGSWLWVWLIAPALLDDGALVTRVIAALYPLFDLLLLTLIVGIALQTSPPLYLRWLAAAVASYACGDLIFAVLTAQDAYFTGHPADLFWPLASVLCVMAVHSRTGTQSVRWKRLAPAVCFSLPYAAALSTIGLLIWSHNGPVGIEPLALGAVLLTMLLVSVRQTLAWIEAARLRQSLQTLNATLEARVHERTRDVRATFEGGLLSLGTALEARDFETAGHTERVVKFAYALGVALNLSPAELDSLVEGAYLHDLGKLAVPDQILLKPGKLTPEEWTVMQSHAPRGHALATRLPHLSSDALQIIRHHHERWVGGGYPYGLVGEAIPRLARVFAVCDAYDVLTSERPYKAAWSRESAYAELRAQAGHRFEPAVVEAFLTLDLSAVLRDGALRPAAQAAEERFEGKLQARTQQLTDTLQDTETLLTLSQLSEVPQEFRVLTRSVLGALTPALKFDWGGLMQLREGLIQSELLWQSQALRPAPKVPKNVQLPPDQGLVWRALETQENLFIDDYASYPEGNPALIQLNVQSIAFLPLRGGPADTVLTVVRTCPGAPFTPRERSLLAAAARTLSSARERAAYEASLQQLARTDALTALPNRRAFTAHLEAALGAGSTGAGLLLFDLNGFKQVNDTLGHPAGDELLCLVARALDQAFPGAAFRLGGDEFAVVRTGREVTSLRALVGQARVAVERAAAPRFPGVTISIGAAAVPPDAENLTALLHVADERLYADKARQRAQKGRDSEIPIL